MNTFMRDDTDQKMVLIFVYNDMKPFHLELMSNCTMNQLWAQLSKQTNIPQREMRLYRGIEFVSFPKQLKDSLLRCFDTITIRRHQYFGFATLNEATMSIHNILTKDCSSDDNDLSQFPIELSQLIVGDLFGDKYQISIDSKYIKNNQPQSDTDTHPSPFVIHPFTCVEDILSQHLDSGDNGNSFLRFVLFEYRIQLCHKKNNEILKTVGIDDCDSVWDLVTTDYRLADLELHIQSPIAVYDGFWGMLQHCSSVQKRNPIYDYRTDLMARPQYKWLFDGGKRMTFNVKDHMGRFSKQVQLSEYQCFKDIMLQMSDVQPFEEDKPSFFLINSRPRLDCLAPFHSQSIDNYCTMYYIAHSSPNH